ncbi:MAG: FAD-dependent monooxygenase, partial [Pseudolabrys sp.]
MRAAVLGGGPGGLNFAISLKLRDASHDVLVVERNKPDDTFGWGVVLSDETLGNLHTNDLVSSKAIRDSFVYWDDIAVHYRGKVMRSGGHGFSGIGRKRLLNILQDRARSLGVEIRFETEVAPVDSYKDFDIVVGADGVNSRVRAAHADAFK